MKQIISIYVLLTTFLSFTQTYETVDVSFDGRVIEIEDINTNGIDFSPVVFDGKLYFTSSREFDKLSYGENNWEKSGYLNVFSANIRGNTISDTSKYGSAKLFSEQIKTTSHTGPISFSVTGDTLFFTQTPPKQKKVRKKEYRPQIYMAVRKGLFWGDITLLPFNIPGQSFAHPCYDSQTQTLYFASDMDGGLGGNDIYAVKLLDGVWQTPVNLSYLNSSDNDVFPFVLNDDIFVASNRSGGKGQLDMYWSSLVAKSTPQNLNAINTEFDDFGLFLIESGKKGFISSNKNGNDDLFFLYLEKQVTIKNLMSGRFTYRNLDTPVKNLKVMLTNDEGDITFEEITNEDGKFLFKNLELNENYQIKVQSEDELDLVIYDKDGNVVAELLADEKGKFTYKKLNYNSGGTLSLIPENFSDFENGTGFLSGQFVYEKDPGKYPEGMKVDLNDSTGTTAYTTNTDKRGNFEFKNLSLDENYILTIPEKNDGLILFIYDKKGNVIAQLKSNEKGEFLYRKLNGDFTTNLAKLETNAEDDFELDTKTIAGNFDYKNLEGNFENGLTVFVYDENGILIASQETNKEGQFRFRNLPLNENFLFKIEEDGIPLNMDDFVLFLEDRYGKKIAELHRGENGYFIYKPLGYNSENTLSQLQENELSIEIENPQTNHKIQKVYYESNRSGVSSKYFYVLNKLIKELKENPDLKIEVNAYADANGTNEHNLELSVRRAEWIKKYLINRGIDASRIKTNGYGESNLVVNCTDCSDEEHGQNRRSELRLY